MEKKFVLGLTLPVFLISMSLGSLPVQAQTAQPGVVKAQNIKVQGAVGTSLSGQNRFETAKAISEQVNSSMSMDVVLTSGNNFPDALSASVLAKKLNAPILLVDSTAQGSSEAFSYILQHLNFSGTVHIIGGEGIIGQDFIDRLNQNGYKNIDRIGGTDRYATDLQIAQKLNVAKGTPVVIASGENFPDALSISSIASSKGYPILLVGSDGNLAQGIKNFLTTDQPSQVYIVGGTGVVSEGIKAQVQSLVPSTVITRLSGQDRFDTAGQILNAFSMNPKTLYLSSGNNFPDALAGSALTSKTGDPILLIDPNSLAVPPAIEAYLKQLHANNLKPNIVSFGGSAVVPDAIVKYVQNILDGVQNPTGVITSTATDNIVQNLQTIVDSLGFTKDFGDNGGVAYWGNYNIRVSSGQGTTQDVLMTFNAWTGNPAQPELYQIPTIAKQLFKFYLPNDYMQLYNIVDYGFSGSSQGNENLGKIFTFDNRQVELRFTSSTGTLDVFISKPGQPLPKIYQ